MSSLLEIEGLSKVYGGGFMNRGKQVVALAHFNLSLPADKAQIVSIAGESGSGKSTLADLVLGFIRPTTGAIKYKGSDITGFNKAESKAYRRQVQAIFQDPYASFNPFYPVNHVFDVIIKNFGLEKNKKTSRALIEDALNVVDLKGDEVLQKHPHQLSGGQRQRIMIARAYLLKPDLIVADEPVSMIDASIRAMILNMMLKLKNEHNISIIYITHDLSTAFQLGGELHLLYRGRVVEKGDVTRVIHNPTHPYARTLIGSIPVPGKKWTVETDEFDPDSWTADETDNQEIGTQTVFEKVEPNHWVAHQDIHNG